MVFAVAGFDGSFIHGEAERARGNLPQVRIAALKWKAVFGVRHTKSVMRLFGKILGMGTRVA